MSKEGRAADEIESPKQMEDKSNFVIHKDEEVRPQTIHNFVLPYQKLEKNEIRNLKSYL
jgi:hypothetical protein